MINLDNTIDKILDSYKTDGGANFLNEKYFPNRENVISVLKDLETVIFPGFHQAENVSESNIRYTTGEKLNRILRNLSAETEKALVYSNREKCGCECEGTECRELAAKISEELINEIPKIRKLAVKDAMAALSGDPAAKSIEEIILSYPGPEAILVYRIAHFLHEKCVPIIPRVMSEYIHGKTGIDIHPAAVIGEGFAIDHGTGVVIGATAILGNNVKLYQGVTLGAKSFPLDADGNPVKGIARHPILEDNVIVYSNATILGRVTIGHDATIGGNIWITEDVAPCARVVQSPKKYF